METAAAAAAIEDTDVEALGELQTKLISMPREDVAQLHAAHLDALSHLERAVQALDVLETGGPLWERAKKLKDDVVARAKVLGKAAYEHNKKAFDAVAKTVGNTRAGHAVADAYKAAAKQIRRASGDVHEKVDLEKKKPVTNEYATNLPLIMC